VDRTTTGRTGEPETLLRRYGVKPGHWEPFLDYWRRIVVLRRRHGFEVLFAFVDEEQNRFTWAIAYDGDIEQAQEKYYADPDRVELEGISAHVDDVDVRPVVAVDLS
jgi:hypothetical protein